MAGACNGNAATTLSATLLELQLPFVRYDGPAQSFKCASGELFDRRHSSSKTVLLALVRPKLHAPATVSIT
jgi:hypothetical protein